MDQSVWVPSPLGLTHPSLFSAVDIEAYEREILADPAATEADASHFFERHPQFLHLGAGAQIRREVILVPEGTGEIQRVDLFRRTCGRDFWDIIELKGPRKPFIVGARGKHPHFSAVVDRAINQAQDYRRYIDENAELRNRLKERGIWVYRPQLLVVVGQYSKDVCAEVLQDLRDRARQRGPIEVWAYTDILNFAKEHYQRTRLVVFPCTHLSDDKTSSTSVEWHNQSMRAVLIRDTRETAVVPEEPVHPRDFSLGFEFGPRELHDAVCSECGGMALVPFSPTEGKPVYCRVCCSKGRPKRF